MEYISTRGKTAPLDFESVLLRGLARDVVLVLSGSLLIAITAQLTLPMWPVPLTGQTFGVLLVGALLGRRLGPISVMTYIGEGAMGLPFFQGGGAGVAHLFGPTGGYLAGFVVAAFIVGWLCELGWDRRWKISVTQSWMNWW